MHHDLLFVAIYLLIVFVVLPGALWLALALAELWMRHNGPGPLPGSDAQAGTDAASAATDALLMMSIGIDAGGPDGGGSH